MKFSKALNKLLEDDSILICREDWKEGIVVFKRPSFIISVKTIVEDIKSLPQSIKDSIANDFTYGGKEETHIHFSQYLCLYIPQNKEITNGWRPTKEDEKAKDWKVIN